MRPFHIMAKPHGPICNLDCTYCYYLEKENLYARSVRGFRMADDVLDTHIRQYIQSQPGKQVSFACNGECPRHRFTHTASGEPGLNYLWTGYKHFFHHVDSYMRFMAEELRQNRAPARVMEWARARR